MKLCDTEGLQSQKTLLFLCRDDFICCHNEQESSDYKTRKMGFAGQEKDSTNVQTHRLMNTTCSCMMVGKTNLVHPWFALKDRKSVIYPGVLSGRQAAVIVRSTAVVRRHLEFYLPS